MSLRVLRVTVMVMSFPRVSGDEPQVVGAQVIHGEFSPRERG